VAQATVTAVDTSGTTGTSTITLDATKATFTGGAGKDNVTTSAAAPTKAIALGDGDDSLTLASGTTAVTGAITGGAGTDTLSMVAADAVTASSTAVFAGKVTGFEALTLTGATGAQAVDLAKLGAYTKVTSHESFGTLTLNNLASGGTLTITGDTAGKGYVANVTSAAVNTTDSLNLVLSKAGLLTAGLVTAADVETVNITTADTQTTPTNPLDTLTLEATSAATVTIAGNAGLNLSGVNDLALTSLDASGITKGSFTFTSGALTAAAAIKGSATGTNTVTFSAAVNGAVTYTGGTGNDVITASNGKNNVIDLGDGTNSVTGTAGNNTITGGAGADTVTVTTGNNVVNLGNGTNAFTATTGNNTYVGGTGVDTISVGSGTNTITTGTGADVVTITTAGANVNVYSTITDAHAGMQIAFTNLGTETFVSAKATLAPTAVFQDYANAVVAGATQADHSQDGAFGWFQYGGNTFLVEVKHTTAGGINQTFVNGVDQIVCLTGLVDLSTATGGTTNILTLA
jgi:S-layer protein